MPTNFYATLMALMGLVLISPHEANAQRRSRKMEEAPVPSPAAGPDKQPVLEQREERMGSAPNCSVSPAAATESADIPAGKELELGKREARRRAAERVQAAVWAGSGVASRRFSYSDPVGRRLANYSLPAAPVVTFGIEVYPAASSDVPVLRDLGIRAQVSRGFPVGSDTPQGTTLDTSWTRFGGDVRQRMLGLAHQAFELGLSIGVDASYFAMKPRALVPALVPEARTVALRFGADGRLRIGQRTSLLAAVAYLHTTSHGEIYDNFRDPTVRGFDAELGVAIEIGSGFDLRIGTRYTRYFASFSPQLGDEFVAGGALDEQLQTGINIRYAN